MSPPPPSSPARGYRGALQAIVALAEADPTAYHTNAELHAAVYLAEESLGRLPHPAARLFGGALGRYLLGLWAETVTHADPCDCDLDDEQLGVRCATVSGARPALLLDEGGFAPTLLMYLPPPPDPEAEGRWAPVWVHEPAAPAGPGPSSPLEARIGRPPARGGEAHIEDWPPTPGEVQADQEGQR